MKKETYYSVGEIFRLGLLKNHQGEPYKHKASVINVIHRHGLATEKVSTAWGEGYKIPLSAIEKYNTRA